MIVAKGPGHILVDFCQYLTPWIAADKTVYILRIEPGTEKSVFIHRRNGDQGSIEPHPGRHQRTIGQTMRHIGITALGQEIPFHWSGIHSIQRIIVLLTFFDQLRIV